MRKMYNLDDADRLIISLLAENPESCQNEIAQLLDISQPSVGARIRKLKNKDLLRIRLESA